jgi:ATP-dependent Clp protease ATP-binding subunit ClpA
MGQQQVGTGHLLLGLLSEPEGVAARAIVALGVTPEQVRAGMRAGPVPDSTTAPEQIPFAAQAKDVFELSLREALRRGHNYIGTEHLLLGILVAEEGTGAQVLTELGITHAQAGAWITQALNEIVAARSR